MAATAALSARLSDHLGGAQIIAGYIAVGGECDIALALNEAARRGVRIALPHVTGPGQAMRFLSWAPGDPLETGPSRLRQPVAIAEPLVPNVILTPLLGFDRSLERLGQGAGYYDRAFAALPAARRIGVAWSVQEVPALPLEPWDVRLHAIATEHEWLEVTA